MPSCSHLSSKSAAVLVASQEAATTRRNLFFFNAMLENKGVLLKKDTSETLKMIPFWCQTCPKLLPEGQTKTAREPTVSAGSYAACHLVFISTHDGQYAVCNHRIGGFA